MISLKFKLGFILILLIVGYFVHSTLKPINSQSINTAVVEKHDKTNFATRVYGSISPIFYNGEDLKQFTLSQPLPDIFLIAKAKNSINNDDELRINLSDKAKSTLNDHWVKTLNHRYLTEIEKISNDVNYQKEDIILVQSTIDTEQKLINMQISSESISRNLSAEEAKQLVILIRNMSGEVIEKIKEAKTQRQ
jgi:hypothetical protein